MTSEPTLFGKTFDQHVQIAGGEIGIRDISPNRRITAHVIFEPLGNRIRVTARDESHAVLWGFIGCKEMLKEVHCSVAVYDVLKELIAEELQKLGSPAPDQEDPIKAAEQAVNELEKTVAWLKKSLNVKKASAATKDRAKSIAQIASDANRQITLEAMSLKGMKSRNDSEPND